jgi:LPXTG-site transpeptidase (sortase) family protein
MYPRGVIYDIFDPRRSGLRGEVRLHASRKVKLIYTFARGFGAGIIGFFVILLLFAFWPFVANEINYDLGRSSVAWDDSYINQVNAQNIALIQEEARNYGVDSYFSIVIPKIGAKANIIANVNADVQAEYDEALSRGVAHARGTYFPGQGRQIFLFAHSTNSIFNVKRYNAVFYLLDKLVVGDKIIVYFSDRRYVYKVSGTKIVAPNDTSFFNSWTGGEQLVLQTCYPPGTSWNRLLVFADVDK